MDTKFLHTESEGEGINVLETFYEFKEKKSESNIDPEVFFRKTQFLSQQEYRTKRAFDLVFATLGLIGLIILAPIIGLILKLSSNGPILVKQERIGKQGKTFFAYQFCTDEGTRDRMFNSVYFDPQHRLKKGINSFLVKTGLYNAPRFINVLKGDMSIVGPPPFPELEALFWDQKHKSFYQIYSVKPGIISPSFSYGSSLSNFKRDLKKELFYVNNQSLYFDFKSVFKSITTLFKTSSQKRESEIIDDIVVNQFKSKTENVKKDISEVRSISKRILNKLEKFEKE